MAHTVEDMLDTILRHEGGYVDDPDDRGGATNMGITQQTLAEWRGHEVTREDVRALTENEAREIYKNRYLDQPGIDTLADTIQPLAFDMSVNHGPGRAIRLIQQTLRNMGYPCGVDGGIGPNTRGCLTDAIDEHGWETVNNTIVDERVAFYHRIVDNNETQRKFLVGWLRRAESFRV